MKDRIRETLRDAGFYEQARSLAERGRVMKRLLRSEAPIPVHRNEAIEPFFIVGSGRCGSTLLRRLLMNGDEMYIPPENWPLGTILVRFRRYRWVMEWSEIVRLTANHFAHPGKHADGEIARWFGEHPLYPVIKNLTDLPEPERSLACLVDHLYRYNGRVREVTFTRWGDKTPVNVSIMPLILEVFPRAKFVHLLRDGTDVVSSWLKLPKCSTVHGPALRWRRAVSAAHQFMNEYPTACLEVRYENLVREPVETVGEICRFLSLPFPRESVERKWPKKEMSQTAHLSHHSNVFKPVSSSSIGKGHRTLGEKEKAQITDLIGEELIANGYTSPES